MRSRAELCSDEATLDALWTDSRAVWLGVCARGSFAVAGGEPLWVRTSGSRPVDAVFVGEIDGVPRFAQLMDEGGAEPREVLARVPVSERPLYLAAAALIQWHVHHRFCHACGSVSEPRQGGWLRRCHACETDHYPRQDPAIIVAVRRGEELLLANNASWPTDRRALLAGFVEAGESFEECVSREVREEVGLDLGQVRYLGSQAWPFPRSVMIAFEAEALPGDIVVDGVEVVLAQFYTREQFQADTEAGRVRAPHGVSVAARLIRQWLAREPFSLD